MLSELSTFRLPHSNPLSELADIDDHGRQIVVLYLLKFSTNDMSFTVLVKDANNIAKLTRMRTERSLTRERAFVQHARIKMNTTCSRVSRLMC